MKSEESANFDVFSCCSVQDSNGGGPFARNSTLEGIVVLYMIFFLLEQQVSDEQCGASFYQRQLVGFQE